MADQPGTSTEAGEETTQSFARRDELLEYQAAAQAAWDNRKVFEVDAPAPEDQEGVEKFFTVFPYPYMNGVLHVGHTFTITKCEFATGYERLKGRQTLFPFAFHCTGMPIQASADKLKFEMETYGTPPVFPVEAPPPAEEAGDGGEGGSDAAAGGAAKKKKKGKKGKATKGKQAKKSTGKKYQWQIMESSGVAPEDIPAFADPQHWLAYFPPVAQDDLKYFGLKTDWRRSFITTDTNPFYDSFIRWQFTKLRSLGRIEFGKRACVFSPKDGQPCMDHDRASGEGVQPQEYTMIKMKVLELPEVMASLEGRDVFLVACTLRPETMYGQTNCWAKPGMTYGCYEVAAGGEVFVCGAHAARNMAFQNLSPEFGVPSLLLEVTGEDLMGVPLKAPLTSHEVIYTLPMMTIKADKGTGIVTSVPSDAPDDYQAMADLKNKEALRDKFGIRDEWILPFEPIAIIDIPELGSMAAPTLCQEMKIQSQNDRERLDAAKEIVYKKGFYEGVMLLGEHAGMAVQEAKPLVREMLIETGQACGYYEPENKVESRSGDLCVVCLADQWYLDYGNEEWKALVARNIDALETYNPMTKQMFRDTLAWLHEWACSRTYGLGTRLPWDEEYLIESLSDSTIYMAYYTVAHILQGGVLDGSATGAHGITPDQMTYEVWDHVFGDAAYPADCGIDAAVLGAMKNEFDFWYPVDMRVSGKDLVPNHLTFFMYNHCALFPEDKWPRSIRANGHLNLNGDKMSKSTGNFLTLREMVDEYSADAARFALADGGDSMEDANFEFQTANKAILRLTTFVQWVKFMLEDRETLRTGPTDSFWDRAFASMINKCINEADAEYAATNYRAALKAGYYDLQAARDVYRAACETMHVDLVFHFIRVQCVLLAPFCPHTTEYLWGLLNAVEAQDDLSESVISDAGVTAAEMEAALDLKAILIDAPPVCPPDGASIMDATWPEAGEVDETLMARTEYLQKFLHNAAVGAERFAGSKKQKGTPATTVDLYVTTEWPEWQVAVVEILQGMYSAEEPHFPDNKTVAGAVKAIEGLNKKLMKFAMGFVKKLQDAAIEDGPAALTLDSLSFDEASFLEEVKPYVQGFLNVQTANIITADDEDGADGGKARSNSRPGMPSFYFYVE